MTEIINNKIIWTVFSLWGFTLHIFGLDVVKFVIWTLVAVQAFDVILWMTCARKYWILTSWVWINGLIRKTLITSILLFLVILVWGLKWTWLIEWNMIGIIPVVYWIAFAWMEVISIFEKWAIILWDSREWKVFKLFSSLTNMIFNISVDALKEYTENRIKQKINNGKENVNMSNSFNYNNTIVTPKNWDDEWEAFMNT